MTDLAGLPILDHLRDGDIERLVKMVDAIVDEHLSLQTEECEQEVHAAETIAMRYRDTFERFADELRNMARRFEAEADGDPYGRDRRFLRELEETIVSAEVLLSDAP